MSWHVCTHLGSVVICQCLALQCNLSDIMYIPLSIPQISRTRFCTKTTNWMNVWYFVDIVRALLFNGFENLIFNKIYKQLITLEIGKEPNVSYSVYQKKVELLLVCDSKIL